MNSLVRKEDIIKSLEIDCSWTMFDDWGNYTPAGEEILEVIEEVPSADPEWIPVSDHLPNENDHEYYLLTDADGNMAIGNYRYDAKAWDSSEFGWLENRSEPPYGIGTVVAYMPLPEPYKRKD